MSKKQFIALIVSMFLCFGALSGSIVYHARITRQAAIDTELGLHYCLEEISNSVRSITDKLSYIHVSPAEVQQ